MKNISDRKVIKTSYNSNVRPFRYPDIRIENVEKESTLPPATSFSGQDLDQRVKQNIGVPENLSLDFQRRRLRKTGTFIDAFVSFDTVEGAEYYEFRVSKITEDEE